VAAGIAGRPRSGVFPYVHFRGTIARYQRSTVSGRTITTALARARYRLAIAARRTLSQREAIRALERFLARAVWRQWQRCQQATAPGVGAM
jgi:hypothetical protein